MCRDVKTIENLNTEEKFMDLKYRKAQPDDCRAVYNLMCQLEQTELPFDKFSEIYSEQTANENYYCLLCESFDNEHEGSAEHGGNLDGHDDSIGGHNGKVIAALNMRFEKQLHHCDCIAEMTEFAVDAEYRSKGIGKEMFARACRIAKDFGCPQIELATNQLRTDAHRFYEREGMHNFHFKFSKSLLAEDPGSAAENVIGR